MFTIFFLTNSSSRTGLPFYFFFFFFSLMLLCNMNVTCYIHRSTCAVSISGILLSVEFHTDGYGVWDDFNVAVISGLEEHSKVAAGPKTMSTGTGTGTFGFCTLEWLQYMVWYGMEWHEMGYLPLDI